MSNRVRTLISSLCLAAFASLMPAAAMAGDQISKYVTPSTIKVIVERNLQQHHITPEEGANIGVAVDDRIVTLSGTVPNLRMMRDAGNSAWSGNNGVRVVNGLSVADSRKTDGQLAEQVAHAIRLYPRYSIFDWVEGSVHDGVASLTGTVREPFHKSDYERVLEQVAGIKRIDNNLRVLPLSNFDDQIRLAATRALYRDPQFARYAIQAEPPIHIIVENGKLTLKGVVANRMEKQVAESDIRNRVTAFAVTNDLEVEKS